MTTTFIASPTAWLGVDHFSVLSTNKAQRHKKGTEKDTAARSDYKQIDDGSHDSYVDGLDVTPKRLSFLVDISTILTGQKRGHSGNSTAVLSLCLFIGLGLAALVNPVR